MKKIFLKDSQVKMGDLITLKGVIVELTQQIINSNPDLFEIKEDTPEYAKCISANGTCSDIVKVGEIYKILKRHKKSDKSLETIEFEGLPEGIYGPFDDGRIIHKEAWTGFEPSTKEAYDRQELLKEAKRRYPVGTVVEDAHSVPHGTFKVTELEWNASYGICCIVGHVACYVYWQGSSVLNNNKKWAKILKPLFRTEDGVDIYEGAMYWYVTDLLKPYHLEGNKNSGKDLNYKYFSTKEAALKYIDENKPKEKTLEDYENILLGTKYECFANAELSWDNYIHKDQYYGILKREEPKLYWLKVYQLIADDLNGNWISDYTQRKWFNKRNSDGSYYTQAHSSVLYNLIYFKTTELAEKAAKIMGKQLGWVC